MSETNMYHFVKNWLPQHFDLSLVVELIIFSVIACIWIIWGVLYNNNNIHASVKSSRCALENQKYTSGATRSVMAVDTASKNNLFSETYNISTKLSNHRCECPAGSTVNSFTIPLYDLTTNKVNTISQQCTCDQSYHQDQMHYVGDAGLIRFMNTNGTDTSGFVQSGPFQY